MGKKLLFFSIICVITIATKAQITITTNDVALPNTFIYRATDTVPSVSVGSAGTSQTWNMSTLGQSFVDTLSFLPYSAMPNANFSTSNLLIKQNSQNYYAYAKNSAASLVLLGNNASLNLMGFPVTINQINSPSEKLTSFPFTYNSNFTNNYRTHAKFYYGHNVTVGALTVQVDSIREHSTVNKTVSVDAWGTLTTPLGVYNVIRSKETKITKDTIDAYIVSFVSIWQNFRTTADSTTSYTWWANGVGFPLVTALMDSTGLVKNVQWLLSLPTSVTETVMNEKTDVFPNPSQNEINFVTDPSKQKVIQLLDITGRLIHWYPITEDKTIINSSELVNGIYLYSILGNDQSTIVRGKITISK